MEITHKFNSPEEEIAHLKQELKRKQEDSINFDNHFKPEDHAKDVIKQHLDHKPEAILAPSYVMTAQTTKRLLDMLEPKPTDAQVAYLSQIMVDKGLKNAMTLAGEASNPYLEDDFCRYLVQYLLHNHEIKQDIPKEEWKALHMVLFEVSLKSEDGHASEDAKQMMKLMERFYVSMQAVGVDEKNKDNNYFALELAVEQGATQATFFVAVHNDYRAIFEKMVLGVFPHASVREKANDYNIFSPFGVTSGGYASFTSTPALPIATYDDIAGDPISLLLSSFSKIKKAGEGLSIQVLVKPGALELQKKYGKILDEMRKGYTLKRSLQKQQVMMEMLRGIGSIFDDAEQAKESDEAEKKKRSRHDDAAQELITKKLNSTMFDTNIRILSVAETLERGEQILKDLEASFIQFKMIEGNAIEFKSLDGRPLSKLIHDFTYRTWQNEQSLPLNVTELSTIFHFPAITKTITQLKDGLSAQAKAPSDFKPGILLGVNDYQGEKTNVTFEKEDRVRHMYVIGQTGTGKTTILKNMIVQDILNGDGCCFIDPHGSDVQDILACVPPERRDDVIYFDPSYVDRPMGLNMLEYDEKYPEQKTFAVNELLGIFNKLFDMKSSGGPGFEQYFRNATLLVMEHPASGNTLLEIARVFSDKDFRDYKMSKTKNPLLLQFWRNAEATTGEQGLQNWTQYVTSKFDVFLSNDIMRPIIAQEKSSFNFRDIMDSKKIFLINLSKGRMGDMNANLIGLIVVGKFLQAALSRVDSNVRPDFHLYIDEFQNITTPAISAILSEARKYRLSLNIAHQFIAQLPEDIKSAVFGNVGNMAVFRVGPDDAKYLESQFAPTFSASDIMKIENRHAYVKMLIGGNPQKPFDIATMAPLSGNTALAKEYMQESYEKFGRAREEVEEEILKKYNL